MRAPADLLRSLLLLSVVAGLFPWLSLMQPCFAFQSGGGFRTASTLLGESASFGTTVAMTTDSAGNVYIAGVGPMSGRPPARSELRLGSAEPSSFVMKLDSTLSTVIYAVYLSGPSTYVRAIAVDRAGSAYITGSGLGLVLGRSPFNHSIGGGNGALNAFVMKISPPGTDIVYATRVGGGLNDQGKAIVVDAEGNAYVTGSTSSEDFPVVNAIQQKPGSSPSHCGIAGCDRYPTDAFLFKINPAGTALVYSTYLGGNGDDAGNVLALVDTGNLYVAGSTTSSDYPVTNGGVSVACTPAQGSVSPCVGSAFVTEINASGSAILASARLGSATANTQILAIGVDSSANIFVAGSTGSGYAAKVLTTDEVASGASFITKLDNALRIALYSIFPGGGAVNSIAVDQTAAAYLTGAYPNPAYSRGFSDAYVTRVAPAGDAAIMLGLGGSSNDAGSALAISPSGTLYVAGWTDSHDFPTSAGAAKADWTAAAGSLEAFVAGVNPASFLPPPYFTAAGIVNAASYVAGAVSPGEIIVIFGAGLGPPSLAAPQLDASGRVANTLAATRVLFDGVPAPMVYSAWNQVSAIVPFGVSPPVTRVQVEYQTVRSAAVSVPVAEYAPAFFTGPGAEPRAVVAINRDGSVNGPSHPAPPGSTVSLFATGLGPTRAAVDGEICGTPPREFEGLCNVAIGGAPALLSYVGCSPGTVFGLTQINAIIPAAAAAGSAVPITLKLSTALAPAASIAIGAPPPALPAPVQLSPPDGLVFDIYPRTTTLKWAPVSGAVKYGVEWSYRDSSVDEWCGDDPRCITWIEYVPNTSYTFSFVGAQPGRWRVWAVDSDGKDGIKSGWWGFAYTK